MSARTAALESARPSKSPAKAAVRTDEEMLEAYQQGEIGAFQGLVERHHRPVYRFCLRALGDPEAAADAAQEVFLRVVKHAPTWERKAKVTTWLYTIARNFCIDEARRRRLRKTESLNEPVRAKNGEEGQERLDQVAGDGPASDQAADGARMRQVLDEALKGLPEEQRDVFCLREYSGLQFKEIAELVGVGENTVKSRMRYALVALRKTLEAAGFHPPDRS